jgi:hypothetical protein
MTAGVLADVDPHAFVDVYPPAFADVDPPAFADMDPPAYAVQDNLARQVNHNPCSQPPCSRLGVFTLSSKPIMGVFTFSLHAGC